MSPPPFPHRVPPSFTLTLVYRPPFVLVYPFIHPSSTSTSSSASSFTPYSDSSASSVPPPYRRPELPPLLGHRAIVWISVTHGNTEHVQNLMDNAEGGVWPTGKVVR